MWQDPEVISELPEAVAAELHRHEGGVLWTFFGVGLALVLPIVIWRVEVLVLPALLGIIILATAAWLARRRRQRVMPPRYTVEATAHCLRVTWAGAPPIDVAWSDVQRVVPNSRGAALVSRRGRTVVLPAELSNRESLMDFIEQARRTAPPPTTSTTFDPSMAEVEVPVSDQDARRIKTARRISRPAGWLTGIGGGLFALGMWAQRVEIAVGFLGLAFFAAGLYLAIEHGFVARTLGISVQRSFLVMKTVRRGRMARFMNAAWGLIGVMLMLIGLLVLVAGVMQAFSV